ncbi:MAG TPA: L-2-hydroxyglutarate oxidase [Gemmatimonadales bacterium]|nr:L-2-hydroxyglutarate oxidase [Gemmatimonadales bacterium]
MRPDVIVIGAGAIGASTARHLAEGGVRVLVLEKEKQPAQHQSGRNSGVIHAGYNLKPGSLKAKYSVEGSRELRTYCAERGIRVEQGGILVVAQTEAECGTLAELERRSQANGVQARLVSDGELARIEPHARGVQALHAPEGASFDAPAYVRSLLAEALLGGADVCYDTRVLEIAQANGGPVTVRTTNKPFTAPVVVNCAGLQADRLAGPLAADMRVIPFRGYYAELVSSRRFLVNSHVYAAPDLNFPFLGVHLSRRVDGRVTAGPGAMLAFGREAYRFSEFNSRDLLSTFSWPGFYRMFKSARFWTLLRTEVAKSLSLRQIWAEARQLIPELEPGDLVRSFAGNRAQLVSRSGALVDDIVVRETDRTLHVLNAVSPGLTCSLPFGRWIAGKAKEKVS